MKTENETAKGGIGFWGMLQIAFIVLKLCHVIEWSWIWVLSPIWIWLLIAVILCIVIAICSARDD